MTVELVLEEPRWDEIGIQALAEPAVHAALAGLALDPGCWSVSILACDDARISELNGQFRDKARPTNVLSWPSADRAPQHPGAAPQMPDVEVDAELGDIAIAFETCRREAMEADIPLPDHVKHLIVHGTLHLLGYDHETEADAARMEALESEILATLGVPNPY